MKQFMPNTLTKQSVREYSTKPPERSHFGSVFLCENLNEICYDVYRVEVVI